MFPSPSPNHRSAKRVITHLLFHLFSLPLLLLSYPQSNSFSLISINPLIVSSHVSCASFRFHFRSIPELVVFQMSKVWIMPLLLAPILFLLSTPVSPAPANCRACTKNCPNAALLKLHNNQQFVSRSTPFATCIAHVIMPSYHFLIQRHNDCSGS